jgi:hypothetical protein
MLGRIAPDAELQLSAPDQVCGACILGNGFS